MRFKTDFAATYFKLSAGLVVVSLLVSILFPPASILALIFGICGAVALVIDKAMP